MVVGAHLGGATGFESKIFGSTPYWERLELIGRTGVDLFFIVSGFIMVVTTARVPPGGPAARRFLWRRITRIYPPYLVITAAIFLLFRYRPDLVNSSEGVSPDVLASFLLLPQEGLPLLLVGWTLVYEMYFYLVFAMGLLLPRRLLPVLLAAWGALTVLAGLAPQTNPYIELAASPLNVLFLVGVVVGQLVVSRRSFAPLAFTIVGAAVSVTLFALLMVGLDPYAGSRWLRVLAMGLALGALTYGLVGLEQRRQLVARRPLVVLGDWSYSLYLTHVLTLKVLSLVLLGVGASGAVLQVLSVPVAVAASLVGAALFFRLVEQPLLRFFHDRSRQHVASASPPELRVGSSRSR
jgi:peptidoglycan/LPS O-acetylase OafA/YrhL